MITTRTMRDAMGNDVPVNYVKAQDKLRDRNVRRVLARFLKARKALEKLVKDSLQDIQEISSSREKVAQKGNFSARSFDGLVEVAVTQQWTITLDESVIKARELMLGHIAKELGSMGDKAYVVKKIVEAAFKTDSRGFLSRTKIHELLALNVKDPDWEEGARILKDAMRANKGKRYLRCMTRASTQRDFKGILLDIADCWPDEQGTGDTEHGTEEESDV